MIKYLDVDFIYQEVCVYIENYFYKNFGEVIVYLLYFYRFDVI